MESHKQLFEAPAASQSRHFGISAKSVVVLRHVIGYTAGIVLTLLALRVLLVALSAGVGNAFVDTVLASSSIFAWPFSLVFEPISQGQWNIDVAAMVGILMYSTLTWAALRLTRFIPAR